MQTKISIILTIYKSKPYCDCAIKRICIAASDAAIVSVRVHNITLRNLSPCSIVPQALEGWLALSDSLTQNTYKSCRRKQVALQPYSKASKFLTLKKKQNVVAGL